MLQTNQGKVTDALNVVPGESKHFQLLQMFERSLGILNCVRELVAVKVKLLQQRYLLEGVPGLYVRDEVVLQVEKLEARQPPQDTSLNYL